MRSSMNKAFVAAVTALALAPIGFTASAASAAAAPESATLATTQVCTDIPDQFSVIPSGDLKWQFKDSWITYMRKEAWGAHWELADGASWDKTIQRFKFPVKGGSYNSKTKEATVNYGGQVRFLSHPSEKNPGTYVLDMTLSNPTVVVDSKGNGSISFDTISRDEDTENLRDLGRLKFNNLKAADVRERHSRVSFKASTTYNAAADPAFGASAYADKTPTASVRVSFHTKAKQECVEKAVEVPQPATPEAGPEDDSQPVSPEKVMTPEIGYTVEGASGTEDTATAETPEVANTVEGTETPEVADTTEDADTAEGIFDDDEFEDEDDFEDLNNDQPNQEDTAKPSNPIVPLVENEKPHPTVKIDTNKMGVTGGQLNWGIRKSFTTYIRGLAKGNWTLSNGASWGGSQFSFPAYSGSFNTKSKAGVINYAGKIHFTGHKGVLDVTFSNPSIKFNGKSAAMYMNVASSDMAGKKANYGRVHFANIALSKVNYHNGKLTLSSSAIQLTATGAKAFAGFYKVGESLDNFNSNVNLVQAEKVDPKTGELLVLGEGGHYHKGEALAATGSQTTMPALLASLMALCGFALVAARRRKITA